MSHSVRCTSEQLRITPGRPAHNTGTVGALARGDSVSQTSTLPTLCTKDSGISKNKKGKGSPYSITKRRVPELIPVLGSQPAGDVSHKPDGRLPLLSARPAVTPATLKRAATRFAAW